jgi:hypothetical protein
MKEIIGIAICVWLLYKYYLYMCNVQRWKREKRYPSATPRKSKPQFLNIKSKKNVNKSKKDTTNKPYKR